MHPPLQILKATCPAAEGFPVACGAIAAFPGVKTQSTCHSQPYSGAGESPPFEQVCHIEAVRLILAGNKISPRT